MKKLFIINTLLLALSGLMTAQAVKPKLPIRITTNDIPTDIAPDMEHDFDLLLEQWSKDVKYADNCTSLSTDAVSFPDSVYIQRLYALPTQMELSFNSAVRGHIEMYAGRRRQQVSYMLGLGKYYYPLFEEALDREGMPLELKYLPVIESALNPIARSWAGASGLWQFMAPTGKMYNLEINSLVDERFDPQKSTNAAVKHLKDLYKIYNDWTLVIAAYNCGQGTVNKAISRSGGQHDYWAIYPYLPKETRGYVPAFIAATYIMSYSTEHNICPAVCTIPASIDTLMVDKYIHFQQIADVIDIPISDLRKYNPQFKNDIIPGEYKPYALCLPINKLTAFIQNRDSILNYHSLDLMPMRRVAGVDVVGGQGKSSASSTISYKVKRGETLTSIAKRYGVTTTQLKQWNGLKSNKVSTGKRLAIYKKTVEPKVEPSKEALTTVVDNATAATPNSKSTKKEAKTTTTYYKIKKGDTWAGIAKKQGVTVANIKKWNNQKTNSLIAGKQLKINKTTYIIVEEAPTVLQETAVLDTLDAPELLTVELDSIYTAGLIDDYLKKMDRDPASLPRVRIVQDDPNLPAERNKQEIDDTRIVYHKVKIGETITQIANRYNVEKKDIEKWNNLKSNSARVGQRLLIHLPTSTIPNDNSNLEYGTSMKNELSSQK